MAWQLTSLNSGAPANSGYTWTIDSLSATTVYSYRAYVIIDGIAYYGETYTGMTAIAPTYPPSAITTGDATTIGQNMFNVTGNSIGYKDTLPVQEYGVLYTESAFYGTTANLTYENLNNSVRKRYVCGDTGVIPPAFTYCATPTGLTAGGLTYFRAYAKNGTGVGYGNVCCQTTCAAPITTFDIDLTVRWIGDKHLMMNGFGGETNLYCDSNLVSTCFYSDYSVLDFVQWTVDCGHSYCVDFSLITAQCNGYNVMPDICWCFTGDLSHCYLMSTPAITSNAAINLDVCGAMAIY